MITVRRNKRKDAGEFAVIIELNAGEFLFTIRAAKELRDKLSSVLAEIKKGAVE